MNPNSVIRSWKDEEFAQTLSGQERGAFPPSPVGLAEVSDEALSLADGGSMTVPVMTNTGDVVPCSFFNCPTGDYIPCSYFGCPTLE